MRGDTLWRHLQASFVECICSSCERRGCRLGLDSLSTHHLIIIDADKYKKCYSFKGRICDYIVFYLESGTTIAVVELRSGLAKARRAQKQIENTSEIADQIMGTHRVSNFLPILLHEKGVKRLDIKMLRKVSFRGKKHMIIIEPCGSELGEILRKYSPS